MHLDKASVAGIAHVASIASMAASIVGPPHPPRAHPGRPETCLRRSLFTDISSHRVHFSPSVVARAAQVALRLHTPFIDPISCIEAESMTPSSRSQQSLALLFVGTHTGSLSVMAMISNEKPPTPAAADIDQPLPDIEVGLREAQVHSRSCEDHVM